jgi:acyl-CoA thioesterase I
MENSWAMGSRKTCRSIVLLYFFLTLPAHAEKTLTIIGDSITEGYGVPKEKAYPALLEKELKGWKITNAGISGSTSASAPSRMKWALKAKPKAILLALGGNDGLRALKVEDMKKNLQEALKLASNAGTKVLLAGQHAPPNYGKPYTSSFFASFADLAKEAKAPLYPFILEGVAGNPKLNLPDGIHPNEAGHKVLAEKLLVFLKKELP